MHGAASRALIALAITCSTQLGGSAWAAPVGELPAVRARIAYDTGVDQIRIGPASIGSGWVDITVDGVGEASAKRCARLVEIELRRGQAPGLKFRSRIARPCEAASLPPEGLPATENLLLRIEEPLESADFLSVNGDRTTGRVVRYTRSGSAVECERDCQKLAGTPVDDSDDSDHLIADTEHAHVEEAHDDCAQITRRDEKARASEKRRKSPRARWLERDVARERCEDGRHKIGPFGKKRAEAAAALRACVRE